MTRYTHKFIKHVPEELEERTLYISIDYASVIHLCPCGCRQEVVTPLSPTDWTLIFDGKTVSLYPSIGNWSFACQSHYWIRENRVRWAPKWTSRRIEEARREDASRKRAYYGESRFVRVIGSVGRKRHRRG